ncbi:MAG: hypothetical protein L0220_35325 [Acidobacteria bacterium]|nr:hypothetical protein [Acidobacteriota bacterium]
MNKINVVRVLLGGLLAGLVINVGEFLFNAVLFHERMKEEMTRINISDPGPNTIAIFVALVFIAGIAIVYLYALIRPRLGPGVKTAICAGLIAWFFVFIYVGLSYSAMGVWSYGLTFIGIVWGLVEFPLGAVAGAWLYREEGS